MKARPEIPEPPSAPEPLAITIFPPPSPPRPPLESKLRELIASLQREVGLHMRANNIICVCTGATPEMKSLAYELAAVAELR